MLELKEKKSLKAVISYEQFCEDYNPFFENTHIMIYFNVKHKNYNFESTTIKDISYYKNNDNYILIPFSITDHGGFYFSLNNEYCDPWDSVKNAGYIIINKTKFNEKTNFIKLANNYLKDYENYFNGNIYRVDIYEITTINHNDKDIEIDRELIDCQSGFYNYESAIESIPYKDIEIVNECY